MNMGPRMAWYGLAALLGIAIGTALSMKPWEKFEEQREQAREERIAAADAEKGRLDLEKERARLDSTVGRETQARERGYKNPDEAPIEPK